MAQLFNTLEIMEILVDSGLPKEHSKAIVTAMEKVVDANTIATKSDITGLQKYIDHAITKQTVVFGSVMLVGVGLISAAIKFL